MRLTAFFISFFLVSALTGCNGRKGNLNVSDADRSSLSDTARAVITFSEYIHDFGKVTEGEKIGYIFSFTNIGNGPLIIKSAITSCGCTVPKFERKPVSPGSSGTIEVIFDTSGRQGIQTKTISVHSNSDKPVTILEIRADVVKELRQ